MHLTREAEISAGAQEVPVHYMLFDVLYLEGRSMMDRPTRSVASCSSRWSWRGRPGRRRAITAARARRCSRRAPSRASRASSRSGSTAATSPGGAAAWIKVKNKQRTELVIGGWLPGKERAERLGALLVGYHDAEGQLRYAGRVGHGLHAKERARLERLLGPLARDGSPFDGKRGPQRRPLGRARLVAEVEFTEWTNDADAAPSFVQGVGRRGAASGRAGEPGASSAGPVEETVLDSAETTRFTRARPEGRRKERGRGEVEVARCGCTNLDKVLYPKRGSPSAT